MKRTAFTLIELTVVLVLISILAAMAIPRFGSAVANATGKSAAERIAADIAYVQAEAFRRQEERTIRFNVGLNQINYNRDAVEKIWDPDHPSVKLLVKLNVSMPGIALVSAVFDGDDELVFDEWGRPDSGGNLVIAHGDLIWTIGVDADTGKTTMSE